eukprot:CAMPEP_0119531828 /NCGR_PEP_ID=MMETSP1344-20130328/45457_1 /TAXON_ID=236787 /ORGANISM="Florenciella parvula, Strain CCMP2471" /LENGTH=43 /DNA_ID= /DNA_START= /DNA_END= /DNA_ORIENTATION=
MKQGNIVVELSLDCPPQVTLGQLESFVEPEVRVRSDPLEQQLA